ncbi:MAG: rod-binding protein [Pseudomonadota bacterium]
MIEPPLRADAVSATALVRREDPMWKAAQAIEQNFLAEMLKSAGVGETPSAFGGGVGEDQFASYLREEQASAMVEAGGIGLAEQLFQAMKETDLDP